MTDGTALSRDVVQRWIDAYLDAWRTYDRDAIAALFTDDATQAYSPFDEGDAVPRGTDAIVASWLDNPDEPGSWEASYEPYAVEGSRAVVTGLTRYRNGKVYANVFLLDLVAGAEGGVPRCRSFVEYYLEPRAAQ